MTGGKSKLMVAELEAQAMLLGMDYDPSDHTFNGRIVGQPIIIDPDTMESIRQGYLLPIECNGDETPWAERKAAVARGEIGAADHGKKRTHGSRT